MTHLLKKLFQIHTRLGLYGFFSFEYRAVY